MIDKEYFQHVYDAELMECHPVVTTHSSMLDIDCQSLLTRRCKRRGGTNCKVTRGRLFIYS